jgi:AP-1 complex subunit mu
MPELKLGLNDKLRSEWADRLLFRSSQMTAQALRFHQCVRLARFEDDGLISFIPPDGEFELLSYELPVSGRLPIRVKTVVRPCTVSTQTEYAVRLEALFKPTHTAQSVKIIVPLPHAATGIAVQTSHGNASLPKDGDERAVLWQMDHLPGGRECELIIMFDEPPRRFIPQSRGGEPSVNLRFKLPGLAASGLEVRFLKVIEKTGYAATPQMRYLTEGVDCRHRMHY